MTEPAKITYRVDQPAPGQFLAPSPHGFEATLAQLKSAIAAAELWLVHEIDTQMLVAKAGLQIRPTRQLLFFHPRYMVRLLAENAAALPEVPLKVVVTEDEEDASGSALLTQPFNWGAILP